MKKKYICKVCGYIYEGEFLPEKCPICKNPSSKYSLLEEDSKKEAKEKKLYKYVCQFCGNISEGFDKPKACPSCNRWSPPFIAIDVAQHAYALNSEENTYICSFCGYIYEGENPPEKCPICKAPKIKYSLLHKGNKYKSASSPASLRRDNIGIESECTQSSQKIILSNSVDKIFISYKRRDKDVVFKIKDYIENNTGAKCWIDLDGIESDAQFANVIISAINRCDLFIFMYSKNHTNIDYDNDWTVREINFAQKKKKRIVFINTDNSQLTDWFELFFGTKQQVNAQSENELKKLSENIKKWLSLV